MKLIYTLCILLVLGLAFDVEAQKGKSKAKSKGKKESGVSRWRHRVRGWNGGYPQTTNAPETSSAPVTQPPTTLVPTTLPPTTLPPTTLPPTTLPPTTPVPTSTPTSPIYYTYGDLSYYSSVIAGTYSAVGTFLEHSDPRTGSVTFAVDYARQIWYYGHQYTDGNVTDQWFTNQGYYTNDNGNCAFDEHPNWTEVLQHVNGQQLLFTDLLSGDRIFSGYDPDFLGGISGVLRVLTTGQIASETWSFFDGEIISTFLNMYTSHSTTIPNQVYSHCNP